MEFSTDNPPGSEGKSCVMLDSAKSSKLDWRPGAAEREAEP